MADMDPTNRWARSLRESFPNGAADLDPAAPPTGEPTKPSLRSGPAAAPRPTNQLVPTGQFDNGYRPNFTTGQAAPRPTNQLVPTGQFDNGYRPNFTTGSAQKVGDAIETTAKVVSPSLREGLAAQQGLLAKGGYIAGRAAPVVKALGPAAAGADVVSHFNDYKINDPDVDSSAAGTLSALAKGDAIGAFRSLGKGAVETAMDLGSAGANTLDLVVPGKAPVSRAYDRMLRNAMGDKLISNVDEGQNTAVAAKPTAPGVTPYSNPNANQTAATAERLKLDLNNSAGGGRGSVVPLQNPNANPANIDLFTDRAAASLRNGRDDMGWANPGTVYKTVDPKTGTVTYSGRDVSGDISGKTVDGRGNQVKLRGSVDSGNTIVGDANGIAYGNQGKAAGAGTQTGATMSMGQDQAISAARLAAAQRGDWGAVKASYGGDFDTHGMDLPGKNLTPSRSPFRGSQLRNAYMQANTEHVAGTNALTKRAQDITLRGQDMDYERAMVPLQTAQRQREMQAAAIQMANGDMKKAAALLLRAGGDPKALMEHNAQANTDESHNETMNNQATDRLRKEFAVYKADGSGIDEAGTTQAMQLMRSLFPNMEHSDAATRNSAMADAQETFAMFNRVKGQDKVGWAALNPFSTKKPELRGMPNVKGAKTEQLSALGGALTIGAENGETLVTMPDGQTLNFGALNARQRELLQKAMTKGW